MFVSVAAKSFLDRNSCVNFYHNPFITFHLTDRRKLKSVPSHKVHGPAPIAVSILSPQPGTSLHCQTTNMGPMHRAVCLFTSHLLLVLTALTHGGMARLSWPGWLVTYGDGCRRSPIQILTGPGVDWLRWCDQRRYQLSQTAAHSQNQIIFSYCLLPSAE